MNSHVLVQYAISCMTDHRDIRRCILSAFTDVIHDTLMTIIRVRSGRVLKNCHIVCFQKAEKRNRYTYEADYTIYYYNNGCIHSLGVEDYYIRLINSSYLFDVVNLIISKVYTIY
jgi:hypothetical protein